MTTETQNLSSDQKELVAVGASVGAGCRPCAAHHLRAGTQAGLDGERLLAAVTSAERVKAEAAVAMGDHVRGKLGTVTTPALLSQLEEALASLGAALGANDATSIDRQLRAAAAVGASRSQLEQAVETARSVQESAARIHQREAERLLDTVAPTVAAGEHDADSGCGCGDESADSPREAEAPRAASAASGGSAGCKDSMGAHSGAARAMPGCHELIERFLGGAPRTEAEAATAAAGSCKKEAGR